MYQIFKISALILLLGFFLIPKSISAAPFLEDTCCTTPESNCCKGETDANKKPCHSNDKKEESKDCHDCHSCASIHFFVTNKNENLEEKMMISLKSSQKISFYLSPEFTNPISKIWQPPKII